MDHDSNITKEPIQEVSSSLKDQCKQTIFAQLPGEILVHHIIPFLSEYHPRDVMKFILLNHETKVKITEGMSLFRIVGSEVYKSTILRSNFKKPKARYIPTQKGFAMNYSKPKKLATQKDLSMLDKLENLRSLTFESLYFDSRNVSKIVSALSNIKGLSEIRFVKCKGYFMDILRPFKDKLTSLQFIDCIGSIFHKHEDIFPLCTHLVFTTKYFDGQHKKYKSKLITDLHKITPNLTSLKYIDESSKSFSAATPSFYHLVNLIHLSQLQIDTDTFTLPKLKEIVNKTPLKKCTLNSRFEKLLDESDLLIDQVDYFEKKQPAP